MNIQYGTVTSVKKDNEKGAQLANISCHKSDKEYTNCEIITPKGVNSLPKSGDLVLFVEIANSEIVVLGVLEPYDLNLKQGEVLLHGGKVTKSGQSSSYNIEAKIHIKDGGIEIESKNAINIKAPQVNII